MMKTRNRITKQALTAVPDKDNIATISNHTIYKYILSYHIIYVCSLAVGTPVESAVGSR